MFNKIRENLKIMKNNKMTSKFENITFKNKNIYLLN